MLGIDFVQYAWYEKKVACLDYGFLKLVDGASVTMKEEEEEDILSGVHIVNIWNYDNITLEVLLYFKY